MTDKITKIEHDGQEYTVANFSPAVQHVVKYLELAQHDFEFETYAAFKARATIEVLRAELGKLVQEELTEKNKSVEVEAEVKE